MYLKVFTILFCFSLFSICLNTICKDGNVCEGNHTCCIEQDVFFGCCPFENGVCCLDLENCCPNGTTCDYATKKCRRSAIGGSAFLNFWQFEEMSPIKIQRKTEKNAVMFLEQGDDGLMSFVEIVKGVVEGLKLKEYLKLENCENELNLMIENGIKLFSLMVDENKLETIKQSSILMSNYADLIQKCPESNMTNSTYIPDLIKLTLHSPKSVLLKAINNSVSIFTVKDMWFLKRKLENDEFKNGGVLISELLQNIFKDIYTDHEKESQHLFYLESDLSDKEEDQTNIINDNSIYECIKSLAPIAKDIVYIIKYTITGNQNAANEQLAQFYNDYDNFLKKCY